MQYRCKYIWGELLQVRRYHNWDYKFWDNGGAGMGYEGRGGLNDGKDFLQKDKGLKWIIHGLNQNSQKFPLIFLSWWFWHLLNSK